MSPEAQAFTAARRAYVQAAKRGEGPSQVVGAVIAAYEAEIARLQEPPKSTWAELLAAMPKFARELTVLVCGKRELDVEWVMDQAPLGKRTAVAAARRAIWTSLYGMPYGDHHVSYPMIGGWFGRNHTSVMYAVKKMPGGEDHDER